MNISERDKKVLTVGAVLALAIFVLGYGVIPILKGWSGSQAALSSKEADVANLRARIDAQEDLVKQRNALAMRLGSLFEAPAKPEDKTKAKPAESKASAVTPESPKPGSGATAAATPETPKPESAVASAVTPEAPKPESAVASAATPEAPKPESAVASVATPAAPKPESAVASAATPEAPKPESAVASAATPEAPKPGQVSAKPGEPRPNDAKPEAAKSATLAAYIEQSAKKAEATVKSITPSRTASGLKGTKRYRSVLLQVKLQCKAQGLLTLLQALEGGERFVKVEQIQVRRDPSKDTMDVSLDVRAYEAVARAS